MGGTRAGREGWERAQGILLKGKFEGVKDGEGCEGWRRRGKTYEGEKYTEGKKDKSRLRNKLHRER